MTPRLLLLVDGPFAACRFLDDAPPARLCATHTNRQPADDQTAAFLQTRDERRCCLYRRQAPMPKAGEVPYRHDQEAPGPLDSNCRYKGVAARTRLGWAYHEAQRAMREPGSRSRLEHEPEHGGRRRHVAR